MTDQISIEDAKEQIAIAIDEQATEIPKQTRRFLLAALGSVAVLGDKLGSVVEGVIGPSFDRLVERGEALQRDRLSGLTRPAQQSLDAATDAGRQASRMAGSTATTVASETRKQVNVATNSVLEALSKQVDALRESVDELRRNMPQPVETVDKDAKK